MLKKMLRRIIILSAIVITLVMCTSAAYAGEIIYCTEGVECTHGEGCKACDYLFDTNDGAISFYNGWAADHIKKLVIPEYIND